MRDREIDFRDREIDIRALHIMFVSKNIVRTSMREDVFGTFAQMKYSLLRRSCSNNALVREKCLLAHIS
jgi:hypothetical protein